MHLREIERIQKDIERIRPMLDAMDRMRPFEPLLREIEGFHRSVPASSPAEIEGTTRWRRSLPPAVLDVIETFQKSPATTMVRDFDSWAVKQAVAMQPLVHGIMTSARMHQLLEHSFLVTTLDEAEEVLKEENGFEKAVQLMVSIVLECLERIPRPRRVDYIGLLSLFLTLVIHLADSQERERDR